MADMHDLDKGECDAPMDGEIPTRTIGTGSEKPGPDGEGGKPEVEAEPSSNANGEQDPKGGESAKKADSDQQAGAAPEVREMLLDEEQLSPKQGLEEPPLPGDLHQSGDQNKTRELGGLSDPEEEAPPCPSAENPKQSEGKSLPKRDSHDPVNCAIAPRAKRPKLVDQKDEDSTPNQATPSSENEAPAQRIDRSQN
ncbi:uncharacterized protein LOC122818618 [Drosophila biarmipes]|uniref:uncharacterized protein LOC122818618 n=1 Tax=Drosophila biarmipes TaxID=125945 RepID=UPI001CDAB78D|nr:uncharacterized protein LOC122818618 [Drosophila biarmipes]